MDQLELLFDESLVILTDETLGFVILMVLKEVLLISFQSILELFQEFLVLTNDSLESPDFFLLLDGELVELL